jgi:hypothetical protein
MGMTIFLMLYFIGYVLAYRLIRWGFKFEFKNQWDWFDVRMCLFVSLFSWVSVFVGIVANMLNGNIKLFKKETKPTTKTKPPTWL